MEVLMEKSIYKAAGVIMLLATIFIGSGMREAGAQVQVNINLGPPPVAGAEPPAMVLVPGSQVYFVPEPNIDVFYFNGYWWSPRGPHWYRSRAYNGPWVVVEERYVPVAVHKVPKDYRIVYAKEKHIPYGQWKKYHKEHAKAERKAWKEHEKAEHTKFKEHKKGRGKEHRGKGHGEG